MTRADHIRPLALGLLGLLLCLGGPATAQRGTLDRRPVLRIDRVDPSKPPAVRLYLTDLDSARAPITDRPRQSYRLLLDGVPQTGASAVQRAEKLQEPLALTLVIQVSPALRDVLTDAVEASKRVIDALPARSKAGLVAYTDVVIQDLKPTHPPAVRDAIDGLRIRDESVEVQLLDAIRDAIEGLSQPNLPQTRAMVVLSDGLTTNLNYRDFTSLGRRAREKGITVHAIGYAPLEPVRLRTLLELSRRGGGTFRETKNGPSIARAFDSLIDELRSQQILTYKVPKFFDGKLHDFQIELQGGQASNIVPVEMPKAAPPEDVDEPWNESPWAILLVIVVAMGVLTLGTVLVLRWRTPRAKPLPPGIQRAPFAGDEEDEDEEDDEDEEEDDDRRGSRRRAQSAHHAQDEYDDEDDDEDEEDEGYRADVDRRQVMQPEQARSRIDELFSSRTPRPVPQRPEGDLSPRRRPPTGQPQPVIERPRPAGRPPSASSGRSGRPVGQRAPSALRGGRPPSVSAKPPPELPMGNRGPTVHSAPPAMQPDERRSFNPLVPPERSAPARTGSQSSPNEFALPLPDPDEFLRREGGRSGSSARGDASAPALPDPEDFLRQQGVVDARPAEANGRPALADVLPQSMRPPSDRSHAAASVAGTGIPLDGPALVPVAPAADEGGPNGRIANRRTLVMPVEELDSSALTAWIVPLHQPGRPTVPVNDGFTLGGDPNSSLRIAGAGRAAIRLDSRGLRLDTVGERGERLTQPLADGDRFFVGQEEFLFKVAARFEVRAAGASRLEVLDGMDQGRSIPLQDGVAYTVGTHPSCDLVVRGEEVGPRHAVALRKQSRCIVADLGTQAGLTFDRQTVGRKVLNPGDEIRIGNIRMIFTQEDWSAEP